MARSRTDATDEDSRSAAAAGRHKKTAQPATKAAAPKKAPRKKAARRKSGRRPPPADNVASALFEGYQPLAGTFDEYFEASGRPRPEAAGVMQLMEDLGRKEFRSRQALADDTFLRSGITFSVYSDNRGTERIFPFDLIPRVLPARQWEKLGKGLEQRVRALNAFLADIYGEQRILADDTVPREMVEGASGYLPELRGVRPPKGVHINIAGIDLVRDAAGEFVVLEDNVRTPSGVSYVLENRMVMKKVFPRIFERSSVISVEEYTGRLRRALASVAPEGSTGRRTVVLTPGAYNSAYFEHSFLARRMGVELVQGSDLFVDNDIVYARTTRGPVQVDTIYRRVDDAFLDPEAFRPDSMLGVPGLMRAYRAGNVAVANAPGNGVADDKAIYPFVPDMVRFYLGEEPIIGQVRTYICARPKDRKYVLENLDKLFVKAVGEAGGYGMLVGPSSTRKQQAEFARRIQADPRNYIAQPRVELSTVPTWTRRGPAPRRVDLRPYIISSADDVWVLPGGLTRVALVEGSYVVNSSQGGGSKDTWVLDLEETNL
jgi:uncharacterized circularly permuted ATP-grasp superfamily protein